MTRGRAAERKTRGRFRAGRVALVVAMAALGLLLSCQFIIPDSLPAYACTGEDPSSCPTGMACDSTRRLCVSLSELDGAIEERDAGSDAVGPTGPKLGTSCQSDKDCSKAGLVCGLSGILSEQIREKNNGAVCTKPCCTSADCDLGFVCYAPGNGGNFCVSAAVADRTPPATGGKRAGETCGAASECRSGTCTAGRCLDTCCRDRDCSSGSVCKATGMTGPTGAPVTTWACASPNDGGLDIGEACEFSENATCKHGLCAVDQGIDSLCTPSCCSIADCAAQGFTTKVCLYGSFGDEIKWCQTPKPGGAQRDAGAPCTLETECASRFCDPVENRCATVCCTNADCRPGEACKPVAATGVLRCVPAN